MPSEIKPRPIAFELAVDHARAARYHRDQERRFSASPRCTGLRHGAAHAATVHEELVRALADAALHSAASTLNVTSDKGAP
jgi:hypothetical protein